MYWSVVEGIDTPVTVDEAVRRLGGDPAQLVEASGEELIDDLSCDASVCVEQRGSGVVLFVTGNYQSVRSEVIRRLSADSRVHSTSWHFSGWDIMLYAAYGTLLTGPRRN